MSVLHRTQTGCARLSLLFFLFAALSLPALAGEAIEVAPEHLDTSGESLEVRLEAEPASVAEPAQATDDEALLLADGSLATRVEEQAGLQFGMDPASGLSLEEALRRALEHQPMLDALQSEVYAAEGRMLQGSLKPNPEVEAEIAEFMGTAEMRFFRSAATGVGFSQLLERRRKRTARMMVAEQEGELALSQIELARTEIMYSVVEAYYNVLAAQERLKLAREREELAQQVNDLVALRVEGGKSARLELTRSSLELSGISLERRRLELELDSALTALASLWGDSAADFSSVQGGLELPLEPPGSEDLAELLGSGPQAQRWDAELELSEARRLLASAEGETDMTVRGGLTRYEETDSFGFHIGVSMPIARNNRNQGAVLEAQSYIEQVEQLREAELLERRQKLSLLYSQLLAAYDLAGSIEAEVLPLAQESYELTQEGYRYGKFSLLDVLDAQRTLLDARERYGEALISYQLTLVQIEALLAQPLEHAAQDSDAGDDYSAVQQDSTELADGSDEQTAAEGSFFIPAAPLMEGEDEGLGESPEDKRSEADAGETAEDHPETEPGAEIVAKGNEEAGNE